MSEKKLNAGEYAYRESDSSDFAYTVVSGKMELTEIIDGKEAPIGIIEAGKVFGELAVFDPQASRPHSARALEACVLSGITPEEFSSDVAKCSPAIQPYLQLACEKMKAVKTKAHLHHAPLLETDISMITVSPASDKMKSLMKAVEVPVARLPFRIGGYPESGESSRRDQLHLSIPSQENPLRVSRQHCEIAIENHGVALVDLGSRFCTWVNGRLIGRGRGAYTEPLKKGINAVTLGAADGPYKLSITCV